ncbi:MAG: hypothetical protein ABIJ40_20825 [Bacteroidota bacterium]
MDEFEILKKISSNLTERKSSAALSNYEVLCNNIKFTNDLFKFAAHLFEGIQSSIAQSLKDEGLLNNDYKNGKALNPFVFIVPRMLSNSLAIAEKFLLYTEADDRADIEVENVSLLRRGFWEYNHLVTATRQYIDSLVSDSYQVCRLNPKSFNYHVLVSLNSFHKYATESLNHALFNSEVTEALTEFQTLRFDDWKNSAITECRHKTFANKVDFLFSELGITDADYGEKVKNLFGFSSEFAHIGYVSTFFTSSSEGEVIFTDDISPYLPSTENFSELKYEILETACKAFLMIYLPCVIKAVEKIFVEKEKVKYVAEIENLIKIVNDRLNTRNSQYYFFIKNGLIGSDDPIELPCMCGEVRTWEKPHDESQLFCVKCGSHFNLMEVDGSGGYIITSNGPAKVIGADVPDFKDLPKEEQDKMLKEIERLKKEKNGN